MKIPVSVVCVLHTGFHTPDFILTDLHWFDRAEYCGKPCLPSPYGWLLRSNVPARTFLHTALYVCGAVMLEWNDERRKAPGIPAIPCPDVNCLIHWYKHLYPAWRINVFAEACQLFRQDGIKPYISYRIAFSGQSPARQNRWIAGNYKHILLNVYSASGIIIIVGWQRYHGGKPCWILLLLLFVVLPYM